MNDEKERKTKYKNLLLAISAIGMIIVFASMLIKATKFGAFGLLLVIVILMMIRQFSDVLEKIFRGDQESKMLYSDKGGAVDE